MDYQQILQDIEIEIQPLFGKGKVADYIPALAEADAKQFAMSITFFDGSSYHVGASETLFSIQSISKVFTFTMALKYFGAELYRRVGREPSGNPFNSLVQLEYENGIPRNPFINAGAIVITDTLITHYKKDTLAFDAIVDFIRSIADDTSISMDSVVASSEMQHAYRNLALTNLMKSFGNIDNEAITLVQTYFNHCALEMNTKMLSRSMLYLANHGIDPINKKTHVTKAQAKRINAVMLTCGHYDASGDFAFKVGVPGKSGVGGGIVAVIPQKMGICVWSPALNEQGNSLIGTKALELFTTKTGLSIF
ncbi:glutaminase [Sulfurimonas sp. ST-27]|uniref:glutaminase n=1 Tax=Sulfurimonas sp. ST-27 TaxID=3400152 RepID=UPI003AB58ADC